VRKGAALVAVLLAALAGGAAGAPAPARDAKDSLASARQQEAKAVDDVLHRRVPAALARLRASHRALAAALDTLGAAELPTRRPRPSADSWSRPCGRRVARSQR
jgi:hypothetical protein